MKIYKVPKILIIHFSRFKHTSNGMSFIKNNDKISAPTEELDITKYVENPDLPNAYFNAKELHQIYNSVNNQE